MSEELEKAREQIATGQYKKAVNSLWEVEVLARADLAEARGLLQTAGDLRDKTSGGIRGDCEELIEDAERYISREMAMPLSVLAADAVAVVRGCRVLGGHGLPPEVGQSWNLIFKEAELLVVRDEVIAQVPYADIMAIEIGGPGAQRHGGGFFGGGFGVAGAAEGMLVASALNLLTTHTTINTVLCLKTKSAELFLHISSQTPDALRMFLSPVFTILRRQQLAQAAGQDVGEDRVDRLAKLAGLLEKDLITREEFDRLKADLM